MLEPLYGKTIDYLNTIAAGWALVFLGIFLNMIYGYSFGIALAVASLGCSYLTHMFPNNQYLRYAMALFCIASHVVWIAF